ncbi:MAG: ABC transporter substrate-binding protein [Candidatus Omnitrophica bacterium]|nr:ABC transporter substrate-binding protein [Candidatus Omnitrophota bacterium]
MKKILLFLIALGLAMGVSAKKIVSLGPFITESIYDLGAEEQLIANTIYCNRPDQAKDKDKIGTMLAINIEKIVSLSPSVIIATSLTPNTTITRLKNLGFSVVQLPEAKSFNELCQQFIQVGGIVGKKREAVRIIEKVQKQVGQLKKQITNKSPLVFVQIGIRPLFTVNQDSFINDLVEFAGGKNIAKHSGSGIYSKEEVIRCNPNIVIAAIMGFSADDISQYWQRCSIDAVEKKQIYILDSDLICSPSPITFVTALEKLIGILKNGQ